jgi:hypothetical protein
MLYAVQGPAPERHSSLTLSMQLVELCKASGHCGSGGGCDGLQDYLPAAPLAFKHSKYDSRRRSARLQTEIAEDMQAHTHCATLVGSRAIIRVSLERREHHGPYEVIVAGRYLSQSLIRSGFCGPAVFQGKAPARTLRSGSFSKGRRAKAHVRVRSPSIQIHGFK